MPLEITGIIGGFVGNDFKFSLPLQAKQGSNDASDNNHIASQSLQPHVRSADAGMDVAGGDGNDAL